MSDDPTLTAASKAVVLKFYEAAVAGDIGAFRGFLTEDFVCSAPDYLPWGGTQHGRETYLTDILPQVGAVLDFGRFSYESLTAEGTHVVALINVGITNTDAMIQISEHLEIVDGKATSIWVAYYEPKILLEQIALNAAANAKRA
jgi:ketosteroid isomerase-like protein